MGSESSIFLFSSGSLPSADVLLGGKWPSRELGRVCMTLGETGGELEGGEGVVGPDIVEGGARGPFFLDEEES